MNERRRGLGRGLGALIPSGPASTQRPVDVFFPAQPDVPEASDQVAPETRAAIAQVLEQDGYGVRQAPEGTATPALPSQEGHTAPATADPGSTGNEPGSPPQQDASGADAADMAPRSDEGLVEVPGAVFAEVPVGSISPNPRQPRQVFDDDELAELEHSIREIGVLQPIVVRPVGDEGEPRYELVMGERRWRASERAGLSTVPAIVRGTSDDDLLRDALLENLHRSQLNPLEEAAAYGQLLEDFGCTHDDLAQRIGRSRPQISNTLRLLKLPPLVQRRVAAGVLSAGHARALLGLGDPAAMERLAQRIVAEGLSVRTTEELVALDGGNEAPARRRPRSQQRDGAMDDLAGRLSDRFDTRVTIAVGARKGKLTVEFAGTEDLERIVALLAPDEGGAGA